MYCLSKEMKVIFIRIWFQMFVKPINEDIVNFMEFNEKIFSGNSDCYVDAVFTLLQILNDGRIPF